MAGLTEKSVGAARAKTGEAFLWDGELPGFGVRIKPASRRNPEGAKTFLVQYRVGNRTRRIAIGRWPVVKVEKARTKALRLLAEIGDGGDPSARLRRERQQAAEGQAKTLQSVADRFFAEIGATEGDEQSNGKRRRKEPLRTAKDVKRQLDRFLLARFGKQPVGEITRGDLIAMVDDIADNNGPIMANRALAWTKRLFRWAASKDLIASNPAADIEKPAAERKRDRVMTDDEIREVWAATGTLPYPTGHYIKALLLTGRRRASVAQMRRSEIDATRRVWTPGGATANKG
ncbi:MAG TPA: integrase arm-type DNA-binding domain-containing protein, partial [Methylomirabilota bacterium]|nr:integrase arm-type DNA-binding domain-containing protein [Methylomirabilota bacterium]